MLDTHAMGVVNARARLFAMALLTAVGGCIELDLAIPANAVPYNDASAPQGGNPSVVGPPSLPADGRIRRRVDEGGGGSRNDGVKVSDPVGTTSPGSQLGDAASDASPMHPGLDDVWDSSTPQPLVEETPPESVLCTAFDAVNFEGTIYGCGPDGVVYSSAVVWFLAQSVSLQVP